MAISISAVSVISISSGLSISGPLAVVSMVGMSMSMVGISKGMSISMVGISKCMSITIVSISSGLSSSSWLGIRSPLAIISVSISMVGISYGMTITMTISMAVI